MLARGQWCQGGAAGVLDGLIANGRRQARIEGTGVRREAGCQCRPVPAVERDAVAVAGLGYRLFVEQFREVRHEWTPSLRDAGGRSAFGAVPRGKCLAEVPRRIVNPSAAHHPQLQVLVLVVRDAKVVAVSVDGG